MKKLTEEQTKKFATNLLKFTAPAIAGLFGQLALGVELKQAVPFAMIIMWGLLQDYFSKMNK